MSRYTGKMVRLSVAVVSPQFLPTCVFEDLLKDRGLASLLSSLQLRRTRGREPTLRRIGAGQRTGIEHLDGPRGSTRSSKAPRKSSASIAAISRSVSVRGHVRSDGLANRVVVGDTTIEPNQHFTIRLGNPIGAATLEDPMGQVTLVDDDADGTGGPIEVSLGSMSIEEADAGVHYAYLPIVLSRPAMVTTTVSFQTDCSTASLLTDVVGHASSRSPVRPTSTSECPSSVRERARTPRACSR